MTDGETWACEPGDIVADLKAVIDALRKSTARKPAQPWKMTRRKARRLHRLGNEVWRSLPPAYRRLLSDHQRAMVATSLRAAAHARAHRLSFPYSSAFGLRRMHMTAWAIRRALGMR